ncbi:related to vegetatible incompatibility protein HET-E-1 [Phialocephala subalpina]|uniref:Related to vegetatible incompatibility protein HET-E-1 n=1 Tax=Phialocephala subalpina TaxID=576137 RepID=A0A1L7X1E2_9HELO|nr:related to vegetatible incompatibility protein HET-E-1 [Phialocephala subalpina]
MADKNTFERRRLDNIKRNGALLKNLGVNQQAQVIHDASTSEPAKKRRKVEKTNLNLPPSRTSARLASTPSKPTYNEDSLAAAVVESNAMPKSKYSKQRTSAKVTKFEEDTDTKPEMPTKDLAELQASWSSWEPVAPPPTRNEEGTFHFPSHPDFTPNKSPEEVLREGCFGGSYFRPLYSKKLGITISNDYLELPPSWTTNLNTSSYLTSPAYNPEINKFKVACGQSIEQWEEAGWINHDFDVRGWFQWYCRFFMGRRCEDDERQVSRWKKCVGKTGRWRRMLLKKYVAAGVGEVWDDGEEDQEEVSPVMHQTCHHWAFCVTQDVLDEYWRTGK